MGYFDNLSVDKVSLVGSPANKRPFLLMKGSKKKNKKEDSVVKKSIIKRAVVLLRKHRDDAKTFLKELQKYYKEKFQRDATEDELKLAGEAAEAVLDAEADADAARKAASEVVKKLSKDTLKKIAAFIKKHSFDDVKAFLKELKKEEYVELRKAMYADLSFWFSEEDALAIFTSAQAAVSKGILDEPSNPSNANDPTQKGDDIVTEAEKQALEKSLADAEARAEAAEKVAKAAEESVQKLSDKIAKSDEAQDIRTAKEWLRKEAPYAGVDVDETAKELVEADKVSKSVADNLRKALKKASEANRNSDDFQPTGRSGRPVRFQRSRRSFARSDRIPAPLAKVLKDAESSVQKGEATSQLDAIQAGMNSDEAREAYVIHRNNHDDLTRGRGDVASRY